MLTSSSFRGVIAAPVTPFTADARALDLPALERLVVRMIEAGVTGLMPCGTTGENAMLIPTERIAVIERIAATVRGRIPVIAGTGTAATHTSVALSQQAQQAGADAVMVIVPYYTKPTQAGIVAHVSAVHDAVSCPVMLYNNPHRSGIPLDPETVERICELAPRVVAIKDSTGNIDFCQEIVRRLGDRIAIVTGADETVVATLPLGAKALASVVANLIPERMVELVSMVERGQTEAARAAQHAVLPMCEAVFAEPYPATCKAGLAELGMAEPAVRLPLLPASTRARQAIAEELRRLEVRAAATG